MYKESDLLTALQRAHEAGDTDGATLLAQTIDQQRTAWSQKHGFGDNSVVNKYGLDEAERQRLEVYGGNYNPAKGMGMGEAAAVSVGRGLMDLPQGIMQGWKLLTDPEKSMDLSDGVSVSSPEYDKYTAEKTKELEGFQKVANERPVTATLGRIAGNMASTAPIPAAGGKTAMGRMGNTIAQNAALSGAEFVPEGGNRLQNMMIGGATAGVMQAGLAEPSIKAANKIANAKAGNLDISDAKKTALQYAKDNDLPLYYDDLSDTGTAAFLGQQIDQVPVIGGAKDRMLQNQAARDEAQKVVNKFMPDAQLDDLHTTVSKSALNKVDRAKEIASLKYKRAYDQLNAAGEIDLPQVRQKAQELIQEQAQKGSMGDSGLVKKLQAIADAPNGNFEQWADYRSDLLDTIRTARSGKNSVIGNKASGTLETLSRSLNEALDGAASEIGGSGGQQWRSANKFYNDTVVQYKSGALNQALKSNDSDRVLNLLIGQGSGKGTGSKSVAKQLYSGLDNEGKEAVRYAMLDKSLERATGDNGDFSLTMFANMLDGYKDKTDIFFNSKDRAMIDGLKKYMKTAQEATGYNANIRTGQKGIGTLYGGAAGAGLIADPGTTTAVGVGIYGLRKLIRSERGRSLLLAYSNLTPESKQAAELAQKINAYLARAGAFANTQPDPQSQDEQQ
jgi:hypothetical protein